jgi:hypothetical protein
MRNAKHSRIETPGMFNTGPACKKPNPGARRHDPETSQEAAAKLNVTGLQRVVLWELRQAPAGLTTAEVAVRANASIVSISPRTGPLVKAGLIEDSGRTRIPKGKTRHGKVWVITGAGLQWLSKNPPAGLIAEVEPSHLVLRSSEDIRARQVARVESDVRYLLASFDCSEYRRTQAEQHITTLFNLLKPEPKEPPQ